MDRDGSLRNLLQDAHLNLLIGAGTASPYFSVLGNIEETLTEIDLADAPADAKAVAKASVEAVFFDTVIAQNSALLDDPADRPQAGSDLLKHCQDLLRVLHSILQERQSSLLSKQLSIFTPNVDVSLDLAFEGLGFPYSDGFAGKIQPRFDFANFGLLNFRQSPFLDHISEIPTFNLHRLHGSVSWIVPDRTSEHPFEFDRSLRQITSVGEALDAARTSLCPIANRNALDSAALLASSEELVLTDEIAEFSERYGQIAIVNPTKAKFGITVLNDFYYEQIRLFANTLEKPNSVLLVHGFSFRDEHLRRLILRAARTNPTLRVVVFCYCAKARSEYETLMPSTSWPNSNVCYIEGRPPDGGAGTDPLSLDRLVDDHLQPVLVRSEAASSHEDARNGATSA